MPEFFARDGIDGEDVIARGGNEDGTAGNDGRAREATIDHAGLESPNRDKTVYVGSIDLREVAIAPGSVVATVGQPVLRACIGVRRLLLWRSDEGQ